MARPRRVPYRPDGFQTYGRVVAAWILDRGTLVTAGLGALAILFVVVAIFVRVRSSAEERAWSALYRAGGDVAALEAALAAYGSTGAKPFTLAALARSLMEAPRDESGKLKDESQADRDSRMRRAESALRELVEEYPDHRMRLYGLTMLARVLEEQGRHQDAIAELREALKADPGTLEPMLRYDIGRNYCLAGSPGEARPFLERATEMSTRRLVYQERWGGVPQEVSPVWRENAEYLLAKVGRLERRVTLPKPPEPPGPTPAAGTGKPPAADRQAAPGGEKTGAATGAAAQD